MTPLPIDNPIGVLRLDPCPSKAFTFLEWNPAAEATIDERGRTLQPAGPSLRVRYRTTGTEMEFFPVSHEEAIRILNPGPEFDFSIGRAVSQICQPYKSKRMVKVGERQETKRQREATEKQAGRRWLA